MPIPTVTELNEGKEDLDDLESLVNGTGNVQTRLGGIKPSYSQLTSALTHGDIEAYDPTETVTLATQWRSHSGIVYRPIPSVLPISPTSPLETSPNTAKWLAVQLTFDKAQERYPNRQAFIDSTPDPLTTMVWIDSFYPYGSAASPYATPKGGHFMWRTGATNTAPTVSTSPLPSVSSNGTGTQAGYAWDASGAEWFISYEKVFHSSWLGWDDTGATDLTASFNAIISSLGNGDTFVFNPGSYYISGGLVDTKTNLTIRSDGYVKILHPVEASTGRAATRKNIEFDTCVNCEIHGIDFEGQHTSTTTGNDSTWQSGIGFTSCTDCLAYNCYAEDLQRCFIDSGGTRNRFLFCIGKTTYTSFLSTNGSTFTKWVSCESEDAYWGSQFDGGAPTTLATGYGFLADASSDAKAENCKSTRSGSDCFRSSSSGAVRCRWVNCESYSTRRNAFSHRNTGGLGCETISCSAYDVGDLTFWTGAANTYTEPDSTARGHYIDCPGTIVDGGVIRNGITSGTSGMATFAYVNQDDVVFRNVDAYGYCSDEGIDLTSSADNCNIHDNTFVIQVLSAETGIYPFDIAGTGHRIANNRATGGQDGFIILGSGCDVVGNKSLSAARHGFNYSGADCYTADNRATNCGQVSAAGAGHYFNAADITAGKNLSIDRQGSPTMYRAAWITSSSTGLDIGTVINRSTVTALRDDIGVFGSFGSVTAAAEDTAANIASAAATINTTGKYIGKIIWDTTNNRYLRASGTGTTSAWEVVDGSASVTPA